MLIDILYLLSVVVLLIFLIWASIYIISLIYSWFAGAPYVATRDDELAGIMNDVMPQKGEQFLELGCGDGRVLRYAAANYEIEGCGVDINPVILLKARTLSYLEKLRRITFERKNVSEADFSHADYIYIFLFPKLVESLKDKLLHETKKPVTIIAHGFQVPYLRKYLSRSLKGRRFKTYIYKITK